MKYLLILFLFAFASVTQAKRFTNQYCEFELPPGWDCALEGTEWVCQSLNNDRKKEAIIILAAKIRGQQDSLDQYQAYLKETKVFTLPGGKKQVSEAKYTKMNNINNHRWVDSLHLASEVPGFYTRYLATVKEDLGVAVTLSVAKDHYDSYKKIFDRIVATLRVFRQKNVDVSQFVRKKEDDLLGDGTFIPDAGSRLDIGVKQKRKKRKGGDGTSDMLIYLLALGAVGYFLYSKKKGKGKKKKK